MRFTMDDKKYRKRRRIQRLDKAFRLQLTRWGGKTIKHIKKNLRGPILKVRTGHLWRSIGMSSKTVGSVNSVTIGAGVAGRKAPIYARIQEKGGTIRPKKAKALTIPLPGIKGVAANYPDAFIIKSKKGNTLLVESKGAKGLRPLFVLKQSVKIPPRHWLSQSKNEMKPDLQKLMRPEAIVKVMAAMRK